MRQLLIKHAVIFAILTVFILILVTTGVGCPIRAITGIPCPGCGITRALLAAMRLQWRSAFSLHPLFPLALPFLFCAVHANAPFLRGRARPFVIAFLAISTLLFCLVYIFRMLHGQIP